jgi:hypothetical protein
VAKVGTPNSYLTISLRLQCMVKKHNMKSAVDCAAVSVMDSQSHEAGRNQTVLHRVYSRQCTVAYHNSGVKMT